MVARTSEWSGVMLQEVVRTEAGWQASDGFTSNHPLFPTAPMHANATLTLLPRTQMIAEFATTNASLPPDSACAYSALSSCLMIGCRPAFPAQSTRTEPKENG